MKLVIGAPRRAGTNPEPGPNTRTTDVVRQCRFEEGAGYCRRTGEAERARGELNAGELVVGSCWSGSGSPPRGRRAMS